MILIFEDNNDQSEEIFIPKSLIIEYLSSMAYDELMKKECICKDELCCRCGKLEENNETYKDFYLIDIQE